MEEDGLDGGRPPIPWGPPLPAKVTPLASPSVVRGMYRLHTERAHPHATQLHRYSSWHPLSRGPRSPCSLASVGGDVASSDGTPVAQECHTLRGLVQQQEVQLHGVMAELDRMHVMVQELTGRQHQWTQEWEAGMELLVSSRRKAADSITRLVQLLQEGRRRIADGRQHHERNKISLQGPSPALEGGLILEVLRSLSSNLQDMQPILEAGQEEHVLHQELQDFLRELSSWLRRCLIPRVPLWAVTLEKESQSQRNTIQEQQAEIYRLQAAVVQFHEQSVQWDTQVRNCLDQLLSAGFTIAPAGRMIPSSKGRNPESNSSPNKDHDMQFSHLQSELLGLKKYQSHRHSVLEEPLPGEEKDADSLERTMVLRWWRVLRQRIQVMAERSLSRGLHLHAALRIRLASVLQASEPLQRTISAVEVLLERFRENIHVVTLQLNKLVEHAVPMKSASLQQIDSMMLILQAEFDDRLWDTRLESFSLHFVDSSTMDHQVEQTEGEFDRRQMDIISECRHREAMMVKEVEAARRERDDAHKKCTLLEREIASKRALISELEQENSRWEVEFRELGISVSDLQYQPKVGPPPGSCAVENQSARVLGSQLKSSLKQCAEFQSIVQELEEQCQRWSDEVDLLREQKVEQKRELVDSRAALQELRRERDSLQSRLDQKNEQGVDHVNNMSKGAVESQLELEILSQQAEIDRLRTLLTARDLQAAEVDEEAKHAVPLQQETELHRNCRVMVEEMRHEMTSSIQSLRWQLVARSLRRAQEARCSVHRKNFQVVHSDVWFWTPAAQVDTSSVMASIDMVVTLWKEGPRLDPMLVDWGLYVQVQKPPILVPGRRCCQQCGSLRTLLVQKSLAHVQAIQGLHPLDRTTLCNKMPISQLCHPPSLPICPRQATPVKDSPLLDTLEGVLLQVFMQTQREALLRQHVHFLESSRGGSLEDADSKSQECVELQLRLKRVQAQILALKIQCVQRQISSCQRFSGILSTMCKRSARGGPVLLNTPPPIPLVANFPGTSSSCSSVLEPDDMLWQQQICHGALLDRNYRQGLPRNQSQLFALVAGLVQCSRRMQILSHQVRIRHQSSTVSKLTSLPVVLGKLCPNKLQLGELTMHANRLRGCTGVDARVSTLIDSHSFLWSRVEREHELRVAAMAKEQNAFDMRDRSDFDTLNADSAFMWQDINSCADSIRSLQSQLAEHRARYQDSVQAMKFLEQQVGALEKTMEERTVSFQQEVDEWKRKCEVALLQSQLSESRVQELNSEKEELEKEAEDLRDLVRKLDVELEIRGASSLQQDSLRSRLGNLTLLLNSLRS